MIVFVLILFGWGGGGGPEMRGGLPLYMCNDNERYPYLSPLTSIFFHPKKFLPYKFFTHKNRYSFVTILLFLLRFFVTIVLSIKRRGI